LAEGAGEKLLLESNGSKLDPALLNPSEWEVTTDILGKAAEATEDEKGSKSELEVV
jgi:hypothetical protein